MLISKSTNYLQGSSLGPIARLSTIVFLVVTMLIGLRFGEDSQLAFLARQEFIILLFGLAVGALILTPIKVVMKIPLSISILALLVWMAFSIGWTYNSVATKFIFTRTFPLYFGMLCVSGIVSFSDIKLSMVWFTRIIVVSTFIAAVIFPETRIHINADAFAEGTYPGWHGFFGHKNIMSPVLVLGLLTVYLFDKNTILKYSTMVSIAVLLILSTSATGLSAAILGLSFLVWLKLFRDFDSRSSTLFFVVSIFFGVVILGAVITSLGSIAQAYGKDLTFTGRTDIWSTAITFIGREPFLGYGLNGIFWRGDGGSGPESYEFWGIIGFRISHVHNGILDLILQIGLIGAVLYAGLVLSTLYGGWKIYDDYPDISLWIVSVLFAQIFIGLSESVFLGGWLLLIFLMKVMTMRANLEKNQNSKLSLL